MITTVVKMPDPLDFSKDGIFIRYSFIQTHRKYTNPDFFAGLIWALGELSRENFIESTGYCFYDGSCYPSQLHVNGWSMDTIYFNSAGTWATQTAAAWSEDRSFIEILNSFRFRTFRIGVNHTSLHSVTGYVNGGTLHNNHLHFENFDFDSVITVRE